jgi:RNA polymerase sigma factor (sigma-70 family)
MSAAPKTRWTLVRKAAACVAPDRDDFAALYEPAVRGYLAARWAGSPWAAMVDDAVQDVFVDLFRDGGALGRAAEGRAGGFRAFLFGVVRVVALRHERERRRKAVRTDDAIEPDDLPADDAGPSSVFDRSWALALLREAGERQREHAEARGDDALRRVELLRLRFREGLPIRDIATLWGEDPARVHHEYARARREYHEALREVVGLHHSGGPEEIEAEVRRLLEVVG